MKKCILKTALLITCMSCLSNSFSQEISEKNTLFKKRIVKALDLREKQNKPLFAQNNELSRVLLNAVLEGKIPAYTNDSLINTLSPRAISSRLVIQEGNNLRDTIYIEDELEKELFIANSFSYSYIARDLYQVELSQDWIIDNKKSVLKKENQIISLFIPADHPENVKGFQQNLFTVKYSDCVDLWKSDPNAIWFNPYNDNEHLSLENAFELELYSSYIVKISNADNEFIADIHPEQKSIIEAKRAEARLMEYESNLWEN